MPRPQSRTQPSQRPFTVEFLGTMAIVSAFLVFMYALTFQPETSDLLLSAVALLIVGIVMATLLVGVVFRPFDFRRLAESVVWSVFAVVIIWLVNKAVPFTLGVQVINLKWYSVLMGVAEECFFRLFLCNFVARITTSDLFAMFVSSWVWSIYHISRYGGNIGALWIVLCAGFALGYVILRSRMGDGVIFAHALVNFLAVP